MRGPGEFLGRRQHGIGELSAARLAGHMDTLNDARAAADELLASHAAEGEALIRRAKALLEERGGIAPN